MGIFDRLNPFHKKETSEHEGSDIHVALVFKDFAAWLKASCVGLNIAGYTTAAVLKENGIDVNVFPVRNNIDIVNAIDRYQQENKRNLTHVIISAPWLSVMDMEALLQHFSYIKFLILSHSNVGFLQADPWGVELFRRYIDLSATYSNIEVGGNSDKFVKWLSHAYNTEAVLLPNLYPISEDVHMKPAYDGNTTLKIGIFGAPRPQKNFMTAAAAAILMQRRLGVNVEIHMNADTEDHQNVVSQAINQMTKDLEGVKLVKHNWAYWDDFIKIIGSMDLLLQPSYTESFNMITADGISVGVPSVVSSAIYWAPDDWKADSDDCMDIAETGIMLLDSYHLKYQGLRALKEHNRKSLKKWLRYVKQS